MIQPQQPKHISPWRLTSEKLLQKLPVPNATAQKLKLPDWFHAKSNCLIIRTPLPIVPIISVRSCRFLQLLMF